jgi:hypothetical protein
MGYDPYYYGDDLPLRPEDRELLDSVRDIMAREQHEHAAEADAAEAQAAHDQQLKDIVLQLGEAEAQIGRPLTGQEVRAVSEKLWDYGQVDREPDVYAALEQLEAEGRPLIATDDHSGRVKLMMSLTEDRDAREQGVDPYDILTPPEPSREFYDMSTNDGRTAWMVDRKGGADVDERQVADAPDAGTYTERVGD